MSIADWSGSHLNWDRDLASWKERIGAVFGRRELKESCGYFLDGLLSGIERKTAWMMAEQAGPEQASLERPWRIQALLGRSRWEADAMRDDVRGYVVEALLGARAVFWWSTRPVS